MAKLIFRYGVMGSSKSANALMVAKNYEKRGQRPLLLKPKMDGDEFITSRVGISHPCMYVETVFNWEKGTRRTAWLKIHDVIIVDEAHFLEPEYIDLLAECVDKCDIPVICYGLRTDFQGHLFPASKRLMELADKIEELPTICWCGRKAVFDARLTDDGEMAIEGDVFAPAKTARYVQLCRKHFHSKTICKPYGIEEKKGEFFVED